MKLHRLELEGFGPFRERQCVDFDAFSGDGIFLIAGRTGAGKSSILDGVCFALYGGVPRYDGTDRRLRSDHCAPDDPTEVSLEFTVAGRRWRATRAPEYERPKRRGDGVTAEPARAQLDELIDDAWRGVASGWRDVGVALGEILGLNQQQFLQVILLAQNRFQRFLLARNDERQALLRTLFGTRAYEEYEASLERRRRDAEAAVTAAAERVAVHLDAADDLVAEHDLAADDVGDTADARIAHAERSLARAAYRAQVAAQARDDAECAHRDAADAHARMCTLTERVAERRRARSALQTLLAQQDAIVADRAVLDAAVRAEALRAPIAAAQRAASATAAAAEVVASARSAWTDAGEHPADAEQLRVLIEQVTGELAVARAAAERERELDAVRTAAAAAHDEAARVERLLHDLDAQCAAIPAEILRIEQRIAATAVEAAALESLREGRDRLVERLASARDADRLAGELHAAEVAHAQRSGELEQAVRAVTDLLRRRLAGYAGELAAALVDGEACAVCGSTTHPHPGASRDAPVTDAMVADAEVAKDAASAAERAASEVARAVRISHTAAAARAAGEPVTALVTALAAAESALAAAVRADQEHGTLLAARAEILSLQAAAEAERTTLAASVAVCREEAATARDRAAQLGRAVEAARGGHVTVAERVDAIRRRLELARAFAAALTEHTAREVAHRDARADRDARIAASAFADADAATDALLDDHARTVIDARIRAHEAALHTERERLRDLELQLAGIDDDAVDVVASARTLDECRAWWDAAVAAAASASEASARLSRIVERATASSAELAALTDEHAAIARLANTVAGRAPNTHRMTLEAFVLAAELEQIVAAANLRLHEMSSGRYRLAHTDARAARNAASGLGIEVLDAFTGQARPAQSLSGGETFLASLALALGLAEVVTGRAGGLRLDTLFIDEGFGSLDAETLELAMATLDELRQGGRTVGVISHVEAMKEQLPAQLVVEAVSAGSSVIRQGVAALL